MWPKSSKKKKLLPDWIVCSTATQCPRDNGVCVVLCFRLTKLLRGIPIGDLPCSTPQKYVDVLRDLDGDANTVLIVGHNPGLEVWVEMLGGESAHFPTAALAQFELPIDSWSELTTKTHGELKMLWNPKEGDELE